MRPSVERSRDYIGFDRGFGDVAWAVQVPVNVPRQSIRRDVAQENGAGSTCIKNRQ
jgi:hypothetical protein